MAKTDSSKHLRCCSKSTKAKLKRREEKTACLEAKIVQLEEDAKKKSSSQTTDIVLQSMARQSPDISSPNSLSGMHVFVHCLKVCPTGVGRGLWRGEVDVEDIREGYRLAFGRSGGIVYS